MAIITVGIALLLIAIRGMTTDVSAVPTPHDPIVISSDSGFNSSNGVVSGSGTSTDPFIIEGLAIDNSTVSGIKITGTSKHFVIRNLTVTGPPIYSRAAIHLEDLSNGSIDDVTLKNHSWSIRVISSSRVTVSYVRSSPEGFIEVDTCNNVSLTDLKLNTTMGYFHLVDSFNCELLRCSVTGITRGIHLDDCQRITVRDCNSSGNQQGIYIDSGCRDCSVEDCDFLSNSVFDVNMWGLNNSLTRTRMGKNGFSGDTMGHLNVDGTNTVDGKPLLYIVNASNKRIDSNVGQIVLAGCDNITVANLSFDGIRMPIQGYDVWDCTFMNLRVANAYTAFSIRLGGNCSLQGCDLSVLSGSGVRNWAIELRDLLNTTIRDCQIAGGDRCLYVRSYWEEIDGISLVNSTFTGALSKAVWMEEVANVSVSECRFHNTSIGMYISNFMDLRLKNNSFQDLSDRAYTLYSGSDISISGDIYTRTSALVIETFDNVTIDSIRVAHASAGLSVTSGDWARISNITMVNCTTGVSARGTNVTIDNVTINVCKTGISGSGALIKNCVVQNSTYMGFDFTYSGSYTTLLNCSVIDFYWGMYFRDSYFTQIKDCLIQGGWIGLDIQYSYYIEISYCTIKDCTGIGILFYRSHENEVHHNNIIKCNYDPIAGKYEGPQAYDGGSNDWDDGYEGNYWADFTMRYPNAKIIYDKLWDTPYVVQGGRQDNYPLAVPVDLFPPIAINGDDVTIPQNTTLKLDGSNSTDNKGITEYSWTITYGRESYQHAGSIVNFTFDNPGVYIVELVVWDAYRNSDSASFLVTVLDTQNPVAIAGHDITVDMGQGFTLDGTSSWDNVVITSYDWVIDPEGLAQHLSGPRVRSSIDEPGIYLVSLNVSDSSGLWGEDSLTVQVNDILPPRADAGPDVEVDQGVTIVFDGSMSTDNIAIDNWTWTFEYEGSTVVLFGMNPSFIPSFPGSFIVTLRVTDTYGLWDENEIRVTVRDTEPPIARAGTDVEVNQGERVRLSAVASSDNVGVHGFVWTFFHSGSQRILDGMVVEFIFTNSGTYDVVLNVTDEALNWGTDSVVVYVKDVTSPEAIARIPRYADQGADVTLDASSSKDNNEVSSYTWTFIEESNDVTLEGPQQTFVFEIPGDYSIMLTVKDPAGNWGIDTNLLTVNDTEPPQVTAGGDIVVHPGTLVTLSSSGSSDNVGIGVFLWTFDYGGQGLTLGGPTPSFYFDEPGMYTINLKVTDLFGNYALDTVLVEVLLQRAPWRLGPLTDREGKPLEGVLIQANLNGSVYTTSTDGDGMAEFIVDRFNLVSPIEIMATKDGWKRLEATISLDEEGYPLESLPKMMRESEPSDRGSVTLWIAAITIAIAGSACIAWAINRPRKGSGIQREWS